MRYIIIGIKWWVRGQCDANCRMQQSMGQVQLQHPVALSNEHRGCVIERVSDEALLQRWMVELCAASYWKHRVARGRITYTHTRGWGVGLPRIKYVVCSRGLGSLCDPKLFFPKPAVLIPFATPHHPSIGHYTNLTSRDTPKPPHDPLMQLSITPTFEAIAREYWFR